MIKLQVIGNLGRDAIVNTVGGKTVINFSVAHTDKNKDAQGNQVDKTTWVECSYWTEKTAVAPYLKKGTQVYAEGNGDLRSYTTQDGRAGTTLALRVSTVQLLGTKSNEGGGSNYQSTNAATQPQQPSYNTPPNNFQPAQQQNEPIEPLDDLPF